jgi:hypothetical protein
MVEKDYLLTVLCRRNYLLSAESKIRRTRRGKGRLGESKRVYFGGW